MTNYTDEIYPDSTDFGYDIKNRVNYCEMVQLLRNKKLYDKTIKDIEQLCADQNEYSILCENVLNLIENLRDKLEGE